MQQSAPSSPGHLYAVLLGGRARSCRVELHDVAFAIGALLEDTHPQLLAQWFGEPEGLHVDACARVDQVEGYRGRLAPEAPPAAGDLHVHLEPAPAAATPTVINGYFPLPRNTIVA